ncbi:hypothetical protein LSCM1_06387 [Leishmania martiniquensis]|uniref:Uncharacterized protein n=1 Tax=Leishmania martiniquensis TaxID=1580590 RepID=A0A836HNR8_9TRYP|nr:hypothetical protein LSCM1_06387 [Leishmania martiniquensis]
MARSTYNKHDIPRELQRLIDYTDRGIEQLYRLAGRDAAASTAAVGGQPIIAREGANRRKHRIGRRGSGAVEPLQDDRLTEAHRDDRHRSIRKGSSDGRGGAGADVLRRAKVQSASRRMLHAGDYGSTPSDWQGSRATVTERTRHAESDEYSSSDDDYFDDDADDATASADATDAYERDEAVEETGNCSDDAVDREPPSLRSGRGQWRASCVPCRDSVASAGSSPRLFQPAGRRPLSSASTPHRTLNFSNGTANSSPASLAKPPRHSRRPHLRPPPSHLPGSSPPPPWRQRQELCDSIDRRLADVTSHTPPSASLSGLYGSSSPSSPLPAAATTETAAYRAHVAAQESTQKPTASSAAYRRRVRQQHRSASMPSEAISLFTSPGSAQNRSRDESGRCTGSELQKTSDGVPAGMLSQFGQRWSNIFKEMLTDPPKSTPLAACPTSRREAAVATAAPHRQSSPAPSSLSSSSPTESCAGNGCARGAGASSRGVAPQVQELIPHPQVACETPSCTVAELANAASAALTNSVASATASADARVTEQLRAELQAKEDLMLQLRVDHARELAELRQSLSHERANAAKQTADELAASFSIKQHLLQSSLQTERERLMEAEEQLRFARREAAQRKMDLEDSAHALEALQRKYAALAKGKSEDAAQAAEWRARAQTAASEAAELASQVKVWKAREVDWQAREAQLQHLAHAAEERREQEEAAAQTALTQVEAEFTRTSQGYQDLLEEATRRISCLEKGHRKHKLLKESHAALKTEYEQLVDASTHRAQESEAELASLRAETQELRRQLLQRDSITQEETESYQEMLKDYKRRLEVQEANAAEQSKTLQQHIDTANHTIELLRSQIESLKQEVLEEQSQHQQTQMKVAQAELQWKETQHEQQSSAAAYKVRTEDTIAQLKRQLREKDAKMQALAASAAEPLQRLRQQLDDERGRRARLEEQFRAYKKKAKEAEEQAASEMRREQLRTALLTPTVSTTSPQMRFVHSATATPSPQSSSAPCRSSANAIGGGEKGTLGSAAQPDGPPRPVVLSSTHGARDVHRGVRIAHPPSLSAATAPAPSIFAKPHVAHSMEGHSSGVRHVRASDSLASLRTDAAPCASEEGGRLRRQHLSAAPPSLPSTRTVRSEDEGERPDVRIGRTPSPGALATAAAATDASAISPTATVESLSGISRTSPCTSTLMPGEDDAVGVASVGAPAKVHAAETTLSLAPPTANSPACADETAAEAPTALDTTTRHAYADPAVQAHEHRMNTFHASASEVLRRIVGSREEFLAQCAAIVKSSAAASLQGAQARRGVADRHARAAVSHDRAGASAMSPSDDETDTESPR